MNQKRRRDNSQRKSLPFALQWRVIGIVLSGTILFNPICAGAHEPTPQTRQSSESSATSLLDSTEPNGRVGGYRYDGSLKPTPGTNSRFSNNAKYGDAGNIVGVDHNSTASRFQGGSANRFQSQMDFSVLALRNEILRARAAQRATLPSNANSLDSGAPRMVVAQEPQKVPYALDRRPLYGKYPDQLLTRRGPASGAPSIPDAAFSTTPKESDELATPQQLWMRGRAPQSFLSQPNRADVGDNFVFSSESGSFPYWGGYESVSNQFDYPNQALGGTLDIPSFQTDNMVMFPSAPSLEQTQKAFREYLEAQLLRSPDVNPLSPVQVSYQNGVVTVRGVVPTPSARAAAGRILLADPRVSKVNNLMTYAHDDNTDASATAPASFQSVPVATERSNNVAPQ